MDEVLEKAMEWAKTNKPEASLQHKAAFANSVQYLVTGWSGGFGGPSLREHLVSWKSVGNNGKIEASALGDESITLLFPDGSLPRSGDWTFEQAIAFCEPLCFNPANEFRNTLLQIQEREHCFDDDPSDLEALRGKSV